MARVPNAVLLLPTVRYRGLELGDQAVIDDRRLVDAAVVAGRPCLQDRDALLRQFGRAGIAMGFDQRLQQYFALGADIRAGGALPGGHCRLDDQRQECEEGGRRFPAHWLGAPCRHRLSSELTGQNETPWIRLRRASRRASAPSTRQLVTRILRDHRRGATVFPKRNFGVATWTDWSAWRCSSKPLTPAASLPPHGISASRRKWRAITCADWRRIWACACSTAAPDG